MQGHLPDVGHEWLAPHICWPFQSHCLTVFFLCDRKWLTCVRSIYQIWQRDTVHLNWLSILGMALSTCSNMKMNLMLSLQTHQILLVCIIIIIIIIIIMISYKTSGLCVWSLTTSISHPFNLPLTCLCQQITPKSLVSFWITNHTVFGGKIDISDINFLKAQLSLDRPV